MNIYILLSSSNLQIACGDMNVAAKRIDHCEADAFVDPVFENRPHCIWINSLLSGKDLGGSNRRMIDTFRYAHSEVLCDNAQTSIYIHDVRFTQRKEAYTCWDSLTGARKVKLSTDE